MLLFAKVYRVQSCDDVQESRNGRVRSTGVTMRSGRKWTAATTGGSCAEIKGHLWESMHKGTRAYSFPGALEEHFPSWGLTLGWGGTQVVEPGSQGAWTKWDLLKWKVTWTELCRINPFCISLLLWSMYDTLPTPSNLHRWELREKPLCRLCEKRGTMAHILAGFKTELSQGRYRWCHDKVLHVLANILEHERPTRYQ